MLKQSKIGMSVLFFSTFFYTVAWSTPIHLIEPANHGELVMPFVEDLGTQVLFRWTAVEHAQEYELHISSAEQTVRTITTNQPTASVTDVTSGDHEWKVRAYLHEVWQVWSETATFRLRSNYPDPIPMATPGNLALAAPRLENPDDHHTFVAGDQSSVRVEFAWQPSVEAHCYEFQLSNIDSSYSLRKDIANLMTWHTLPVQPGHYIWTVRGIDEGGLRGQSSATRNLFLTRPIMGDVNADGKIDALDILEASLFYHLNLQQVTNPAAHRADIVTDGSIDTRDFVGFLILSGQREFPTPPPPAQTKTPTHVPVQAPVLIAPASGEQFTTTDQIILSWEPLPAAEQYTVHVLNQTTNKDLVALSFLPQFDLSPEWITRLGGAGRYIWKVNAVVQGNDSPYSQDWEIEVSEHSQSFIGIPLRYNNLSLARVFKSLSWLGSLYYPTEGYAQPSTQPTIIFPTEQMCLGFHGTQSPANGIMLTWQEVAGADVYHVTCDKGFFVDAVYHPSGFVEVHDTHPGNGEVSIKLVGNLVGTTYTWQVRAANEDGYGPLSTTHFVVRWSCGSVPPVVEYIDIDVNQDGVIDGLDLFAMSQSYLSSASDVAPSRFLDRADFNDDGWVDKQDLPLFIEPFRRRYRLPSHPPLSAPTLLTPLQNGYKKFHDPIQFTWQPAEDETPLFYHIRIFSGNNLIIFAQARQAIFSATLTFPGAYSWYITPVDNEGFSGYTSETGRFTVVQANPEIPAPTIFYPRNNPIFRQGELIRLVCSQTGSEVYNPIIHPCPDYPLLKKCGLADAYRITYIDDRGKETFLTERWRPIQDYCLGDEHIPPVAFNLDSSRLPIGQVTLKVMGAIIDLDSSCHFTRRLGHPSFASIVILPPGHPGSGGFPDLTHDGQIDYRDILSWTLPWQSTLDDFEVYSSVHDINRDNHVNHKDFLYWLQLRSSAPEIISPSLDTPINLQPPAGATCCEQPGDKAVLSWEPVEGASAYSVSLQYLGAGGLLAARTDIPATTIDTLITGRYLWWVTALGTNNETSYPSPAQYLIFYESGPQE